MRDHRYSLSLPSRFAFRPIVSRAVSTAPKPEEEVMAFDHFEDNGKLMDWLTRCEAIAASDSFVRSGHPEGQVIILRATLLRAAAARVNWREIYRSISEQWRTRHPHFPDLNATAAEIEHQRSRSEGT